MLPLHLRSASIPLAEDIVFYWSPDVKSDPKSSKSFFFILLNPFFIFVSLEFYFFKVFGFSLILSPTIIQQGKHFLHETVERGILSSSFPNTP